MSIRENGSRINNRNHKDSVIEWERKTLRLPSSALKEFLLEGLTDTLYQYLNLLKRCIFRLYYIFILHCVVEYPTKGASVFYLC